MNCPHCGSDDNQKRGFGYNALEKYQRYQCKTCRKWFSDRTEEANSTWLKSQYKEQKDFYSPNTIVLGGKK